MSIILGHDALSKNVIIAVIPCGQPPPLESANVSVSLVNPVHGDVIQYGCLEGYLTNTTNSTSFEMLCREGLWVYPNDSAVECLLSVDLSELIPFMDTIILV